MAFHDKDLAKTDKSLRDILQEEDPVMAGIDALFERGQQLPQREGAICALQAMRLHNRVSRESAARRAFEEQATTDMLTGLKNRQGMTESLHRHIEDMKRHKSKALIVAFVDLDGFKALNDNCGHEVGDQALQAVADRLERAFRKTDVVCRPGGDELVVLIPLEPGEGMSKALLKHKIRGALEGLVYWDKNQKPFPVGASIGLTMIDGTRMATTSTEHIAEVLIKDADIAMYADKWHGGNENTLEGGRDDQRHPKNQRLQRARIAAFANPVLAFGDN